MTRLGLDALWQTIGARGRADFVAMPRAKMSYVALGEAVRRWLAQFDDLGLAEGDRLMIRTANEPAMITAFIAALLDGVVPVALNFDTPDMRLLALAETVEAKALVVDRDECPAELSPGIAAIKLGGPGKARGLFGSRDDLAGVAPKPAPRSPRLPDDRDGLAYILFTSGTTSSPSGVMITRGNLLAQLETLTRLFRYNQDSRIFNDMVLAHADGMIQGPLCALANGCAAIRAGGFRLDAIEPWLERVRQERASHVITVPTLWSLIDAYAAHDDYFDAPECVALMSVASKLPEDLWQRLEQRFGRPMFNQYGLTETVVTALYAGPWPEMGGFGTIGRPVGCEARLDPASSTPGEGELQLRGENIFAGYWRNPERTAATFTEDGWMKTGDLARMRDDGDYEILGRLKSVIKMGGFLIRPDEIDEAMLRHPAVRESVTIAFEDEMFGEIPVCAVVCREPIDPVTLTAHARTQLEALKVPKRIVPVAMIPRGDSGKPQLAALRELLEEVPLAETPKGQANGTLEEVKDVAAGVFRVPARTLTGKSGPGDIPGWDSFSQLNFILAVEQQFGIVIPASRIAAIATVSDMVRAIEDLRQ